MNYQRAITVSGTTDIYGTVNWASSSGTSRAEAFTGDVTLYSAAVWTEPATGNGANLTYSFAGNFTNNASTFTGSGTGLHTFSGASKTISGSAITNFPSVTFTGAYTNSGKLTVATLLTVTGVTLTNDGTITATTALSGTGGVTQGTTGILNVGAASAITTLTATATGNTVNYTGVAQTIKTPAGATPTYYNLGLSGSLAKTFGAVMAISGNLAISGTAVATLGANNCTSATLQLGGVYQVGGTWGSSASAATNKNATYFGTTGAGLLTVGSGCIAGQWTGATSTNWATASNWCSGTLPTSSTDVTIPSGTLFQPTISATGAVCKNITISSSATLTMSGSGALIVSGNWSNSGTLTAGTGTVTFNNSPAAAQTITGATVFNNLTINNTAGVTLISESITVNGILNLQSANASASQGTLHTGTYALLITDEAASTTGTGDVSGTIKRTHTFNPNTPYSFGSQYTTLDFINTGTQPNELTCKILLGTILPEKAGSVLRYYSFAQTGTTGTDQVNAQLRYLTSELQSNSESQLVFYDHHSSGTVHEHGKSNNDLTNHWVALSGRTITYFAPTTIDNNQWGLSNSLLTKNTWDGTESTNWSADANWSSNHPPLTTEDALIPVVATVYPVLTANVEVKSLEIASGATLSAGSGTSFNITINGNNVGWSNHGTFNPGTGRVIFSHNVNGEIVSMDGITDFYDVEALNTYTYLQPAADNTMKIDGNIYQTAGIIDLIATTNTVEYTGTTGRTILNPAGPGTDRGYHGLKISTTGGGTITFPSTLNIAGDFTNNGTVATGTGTVIMKDNEHLQNIGGTTSTAFYNLTIDNTNESVFVNSPITVSNVLAVNAATTMNMGTNTLSGVASTTGTGSFKTQNTSSTPIPSGKTWSFDADYNGAGQTVMAGTYANLALSASGTKTAAGALSVTGALVVAPGVTLDMVTFALSGVATNSGTGTLKTQNTSSTPIPAGKTWGFGLVEYNGAGQTVIDGTYADLTLSGSGTKTLPAAAMAVHGDLIMSGTATATENSTLSVDGNLTIDSYNIFNIGTTGAVTVSGTLYNNAGTSGLVVQSNATSTGSMIHSTADVDATFQRYMSDANWADWKDGWHFLSSPVAVQAIEGSFTTDPLTNYDFYCWYEPSFNWVNYKNTTTAPVWNTGNTISNGNQANDPANFLVGKGYMVAYNNADTKSFTGKLNVSDIPISNLTHTTDGWYLLGNPFSSALSWDLTSGSHWTFTGIYGVAKIWNEAIMSFSDISSEVDVIPATNGFMVQVPTGTIGTSNLIIPAAKRTHNAQGFYKSVMQGIKLTVYNNAAGNGQESKIFFNPDATTGVDLMYDGEYFAGYGPGFYSIAGEAKLSTNSLPDLSAETTIPFTFVPNEGNAFRIEASGLGTIPAMTWLLDKKSNTEHNLSMEPVYQFTVAPGDDQNRFLLHFTSVGIDEKQTPEPVSIYTSGNVINIRSNTGTVLDGDVCVYNMIGQLMVQKPLGKETITQLPLNGHVTGYYIVKVMMKSTVYTGKVFVY